MCRPAWFAALLMAAALVPFLPSVAGTPILEDNRLIQSGAGPFADTFTKPFLGAYFRPLVSVTFWMDYRLAGTLPFQFHQTNVLLHVGAVLVLWLALRAGFSSARFAGLSALFLAVQPAQVGAVAWIGGRTDSLAVFFVAVTLWMVLRGVRAAGLQRTLFRAGAGLAFLASLLSKEQSGALFPIWIAIAVGFPGGGGTVPGNSPAEMRPGNRRTWVMAFLIPAVVFGALWAWLGPVSLQMPWHGPVYAIVLAARTALIYGCLLAVPWAGPMHWTTTLPLAAIPDAVAVILWVVLMAGLGVAAVLCRRRHRVVSLALLWIVACLLPVSNAVPLPGMVLAPWRAALAGVGAAVLMGWFADRLWCRFRGGGVWSAGVLAWCLALAVWGSSRWTDDATMYRTFLRHDPGSLFVVEAGAGAQMGGGRPENAARMLELCLGALFENSDWRDKARAVDRYRNDPGVRRRVLLGNGDKRPPATALASLFLLLGYSRMDSGGSQGARHAFETALALAPDDPGSRLGLGRWHAACGDPHAALAHLDVVARDRPDVPLVHGLRGRLLTRLGRLEEAALEWQKEGEIQPWAEESWLRAADAWVAAGKPQSARRLLRRVQPGTIGGGPRIGEWLDNHPAD